MSKDEGIAAPGGPAPIETARAAMALYPLSSKARVELVRYGENTTYRVSDGQRSMALRLARPGYQSHASMESEIAWMSALREHGIDTPQVVLGRDGEAVQRLDRPDAGVQLAVAFEWVDGVPLPEVEGRQPWRRLGKIIATLHEQTRAWSPPAGFTRPAWDFEALVGDSPRWGSPVPTGVWRPRDLELILAARDAVRERLNRLGTAPSRFGLIHSDLGFENVLVQPDGNTVLIDFDDCGESWYLYDLASALYPLEDTAAFAVSRDNLLEGYGGAQEEIGELPTFLMCRRLTTLGWIFTRAGTEHAERLRKRRLATTPAAAFRFLEWHSGGRERLGRGPH
jgi:Ser/Thr protein kinase RdoA (MazF antagonist)